eukprot:scaffold51588_cov54-Phaeocystis_antarctica.AAC.2
MSSHLSQCRFTLSLESWGGGGSTGGAKASTLACTDSTSSDSCGSLSSASEAARAPASSAYRAHALQRMLSARTGSPKTIAVSERPPAPAAVSSGAAAAMASADEAGGAAVAPPAPAARSAGLVAVDTGWPLSGGGSSSPASKKRVAQLSALRRPLSAPDRAPGCPKLRPASVNQPDVPHSCFTGCVSDRAICLCRCRGSRSARRAAPGGGWWWTASIEVVEVVVGCDHRSSWRRAAPVRAVRPAGRRGTRGGGACGSRASCSTGRTPRGRARRPAAGSRAARCHHPGRLKAVVVVV